MLKDKGILKALWAGMFIFCLVFSFLPQPAGAVKVIMIILALLFFVPAFADVYFAWKNRDQNELKLVRNLCILSLGATVVSLIANLLSVLSPSQALGDVLYYVLMAVSVPMICGQFWAYSLLLWAGLLWCSIAALRTTKK